MYYYAMLKKDGDDTIIEGISVLPSPIENGYCVNKQQATELALLLRDETVSVKLSENYQEEFSWEVIQVDPLDQKRREALIQVQEHYNCKMNSVALFEMYNVMMINNELAANGYFITDGNREEKYIDIINSGDEKLITILQSYLEMKDRIDPMWEYYNKVKEFKTNLQNMKTEEEVNTALDNLLSYIN